MIKILSACNHPEILKIMDRLVEKRPDWSSSTAADLPTVVELLTRERFELLLLGAGFAEAEQRTIEALIEEKGLPTKVVKHYGGGSGLLYSEITMALKVPQG
jgi:hypothetical protein